MSGCWLWVGAVTGPHLRGTIWDGKKRIPAPRASLILNGTPVPNGMCVCHKCDNPSCVNPKHLFIGSHSDNMEDMSKKGRAKNNAIMGRYDRLARGERSPRSKLTKEQVMALRSDSASGVSRRELSKKYGISITSVRGIIKRIYWSHV